MRKNTKGTGGNSFSLVELGTLRQNDNTQRLAALAAMTMTRQLPGIVLPSLRDVATHYCHVTGGSIELALARSFVELGVGSAKNWKSTNASPRAFAFSALQQWVDELGATQLKDKVGLSLEIRETFDGMNGVDNRLIVSIETEDGCGYLMIGDVATAMSQEVEGLGAAFFYTLVYSLTQYVRCYEESDADRYFDYWKESIESDLDPETVKRIGDDQAFEQYCQDNDIQFPKNDRPDYLKKSKAGFHCIPKCVTLLRKHESGMFQSLIKPVLAMYALRSKAPDHQRRRDLYDLYEWNDGPVPTWIISNEKDGRIEQAFDEEARSFNDVDHEPAYVDTFDPHNVDDVRRCLGIVASYVEVNLLAVELGKSVEKWRKPHDRRNVSREVPGLRAA